MNYNQLTAFEFLNYISLDQPNDLVVKRMVELSTKSAELLNDLKHVGMEDNGTFWYEGLDLTPSEYINKLKCEIEYLQEDIEEARNEVLRLEHKVAELSARSVASLISELKQQINVARHEANIEKEKTLVATKEKEKALHQLNMWALLNK